jgi:hypothetical protein
MSLHLAVELIHAAHANGGGTFNKDGSPIDATEGYVVGGIHPSLTFREQTAAIDAAELVAKWVDIHPAECYGSWKNDGLIHIDAVHIAHNREYALFVAKLRGEKAIYDLAAGEEIFVGGE